MLEASSTGTARPDAIKSGKSPQMALLRRRDHVIETEVLSVIASWLPPGKDDEAGVQPGP